VVTQLDPNATHGRSPEDLASYLRAHHMTIICDQRSIALDGRCHEAKTVQISGNEAASKIFRGG
jgi:hypothetical protein